MRDPARIDPVCAALARVWKRYPDYRLGQLVVNVTGLNDPFNLEDDVMLRALQTYGLEGETMATKTAKTTRSVLQRFERVASAQRLPNHAELEELAEIADDVKGEVEELLEAIEEFTGYVETLVDEDGDRDDRRDARDSLPGIAQTIFEKLDAISAHTVKPDGEIKLP